MIWCLDMILMRLVTGFTTRLPHEISVSGLDFSFKILNTSVYKNAFFDFTASTTLSAKANT